MEGSLWTLVAFGAAIVVVTGLMLWWTLTDHDQTES